MIVHDNELTNQRFDNTRNRDSGFIVVVDFLDVLARDDRVVTFANRLQHLLPVLFLRSLERNKPFIV